MQNFSFKSFRSRYLLVAISTTLSTLLFISFIEHYISSSSKISLQNIEQRVSVSKLNTRLHSNVQNAAHMLDLYLFTPTINYRKDFLRHINATKTVILSLHHNPWIDNQQLHKKVAELETLQQQLKNKSQKLLEIRLDGEKMYPAMLFANGSMRSDNETVITLLNAAILEQQEEKHDEVIYAAFTDARDKWRRTINAYRLYLINRLSSLSEVSLTGQSNDVRNFHDEFKKTIGAIRNKVNLNKVGIETAAALEDVLEYADRWLADFNKVDKINLTGAWRGDVPIILNDIYPLFEKIYSNINLIDKKINEASSNDIKQQQLTNNDISFTLWAIEGLLVFLMSVGYFILDRSLLKPLFNLSQSLRESSDNNTNIVLPDSQTQEIEDFVTAYQHMQQQIHNRQEELEHIAMHDDLTNLPNRILLIDRISLAISNSQRFHSSFAVIILDLDRFKEVNDTLGHFIGDEVLKQVANRLEALLRDTDTVARLGGDEFAILLPNIDDKTVKDIAIKISHELEKVYPIQEHNLYLGASLGISVYPQHGLTTEILLKHADIAMYMAKQTDINYIVYTPKNDEHNVKQLSLLSDLRQAIDQNQLRLVYQPIYTTNTNKIIGFEALIRWQHPDYGLLTPDSFIHLAEQTGLVKKITQWVIREALETFSSWPIDTRNTYISVNVTAWDLQDHMFIPGIEASIKDTGISPRSLMLELSERSMMVDTPRIQLALDKLQATGVRISIDDFGTGFSSLAILKQLPVSILKIDKSFVLKMASVKNDALIVHSIIDLAHNLELKVIAEGVEDTDSRELLKNFSCDYCQGYLFSMPLTEEQLLSLLDVINTTSGNGYKN